MTARVRVTALVLLSGVHAGAAAPLRNGGFEVADGTPATGWTTTTGVAEPGVERLTDGAREGRACVVIRHAAGEQVGLQTARDDLVKVDRGALVTISFWARSDVPGWCDLRLRTYESPAAERSAGYVYEPKLANPVKQEWTHYEREFYEGAEFRAERHPYLEVGFLPYAWGGEGAARALFIDDVQVALSAQPAPAEFVDVGQLRVPPLEHRLRPGPTLRLTVDARQRLRETPREVLGIAIGRLSEADPTRGPYRPDGAWSLAPAIEAGIRELHVPSTRVYHLVPCPGQQFPLHEALDKYAALLDRLGIPQTGAALVINPSGEYTGDPPLLSPEQFAAAVKYAAERGYGFRYWEVLNEPFGVEDVGNVYEHFAAIRTPRQYVEYLRDVAAAVRAVNPDALLGIATNRWVNRWENYVLGAAAGSYDFVAGHWYSHRNAYESSFEDIVLRENYTTLANLARQNAIVAAYNPGGNVYQYDTEWAQYTTGPEVDPYCPYWPLANRRGNIYGTLHQVVRLIYYLREAPVRGACAWLMTMPQSSNPMYAPFCTDRPEARGMTWYLHKLFDEHLGQWVLGLAGEAPWFEQLGPQSPAVAMLSADRRTVYVIAANGSWSQDVPCHLDLVGARPRRLVGRLLWHDDPDANPIRLSEPPVYPLEFELSRNGIDGTLPAHSAVFLALELYGRAGD